METRELGKLCHKRWKSTIWNIPETQETSETWKVPYSSCWLVAILVTFYLDNCM